MKYLMNLSIGGVWAAVCLELLAGVPFRGERHAGATHSSDGSWVFENGTLRVAVDGANASWTVADKRCGRVWRQAAGVSKAAVKAIRAMPHPQLGVEADIAYLQGTNAPLPLTVRLSLAPEASDVACEISGNHALAFNELLLPSPFVLDEPEGVLVIPQNAGLLFRVDELAWDGKTLGGFMSMPWFGAADLASGQGYVCIFSTPDDVSIRGRKVKGAKREVLSVQPWFQPQKGTLGYPRRLFYHFADRGGYVALAKRYRAYAKTQGLVKTLAEKRKQRPSIDQLVGAVNIYSGHFQNVEEVKKLGIERAMVSGFSKGDVQKINELGYLSSRYDIYSDLYAPDSPVGKIERCQGFTFPQDVIKKVDGSNHVGWCPHTDKKTGITYPSYVICWRWFTRPCRRGFSGNRSRNFSTTRWRASRPVMITCAGGGARSATQRWSTTSASQGTGWCNAARSRTGRP